MVGCRCIADEGPWDTPPAGFPDDTQPLQIDGVDGWCYSIHSPYGERFRFFVWKDGPRFQVSLVDPPLEKAALPPPHLAPDGRLALHDGAPTALDAFKASIAWTASLTVAARAARQDPTHATPDRP